MYGVAVVGSGAAAAPVAPARSDSGSCAVRYLSGIEAEPRERLHQLLLLVRKV